MDEMKIVTKFTRGIVSKVIERVVRNKLGCNSTIQLNDMNFSNNEEKASIHLDIVVDLEHGELLKVLKNVGLG